MPDTLADAQREFIVLKFSWRRKLIILSQISTVWCQRGFPGGKNAGDIRDAGSIPESGSPGGCHGNPLQYSFLENPMDRGAWRATVHRSQRIGHDWSDLACPHAASFKFFVYSFKKHLMKVYCVPHGGLRAWDIKGNSVARIKGAYKIAGWHLASKLPCSVIYQQGRKWWRVADGKDFLD